MWKKRLQYEIEPPERKFFWTAVRSYRKPVCGIPIKTEPIPCAAKKKPMIIVTFRIRILLPLVIDADWIETVKSKPARTSGGQKEAL